MSNSLYLKIGASLAQQRAVTTISENMANQKSLGYKADIAVFNNLLTTDTKSKNHFVFENNSSTKQENGPIISTKEPLDLALQGEKFFFVVQSPEGLRYTRNGKFTTDNDGFLVTAQGFKVLDEDGEAIQFNDEERNNIRFSESGDVFISSNTASPVSGNGNSDNFSLKSRLQIAWFSDSNSLRKSGFGTFKTTTDAPQTRAEGYRVMQGALEDSNVDAAQEMQRMIEAQRMYDSTMGLTKSELSMQLETMKALGKID